MDDNGQEHPPEVFIQPASYYSSSTGLTYPASSAEKAYGFINVRTGDLLTFNVGMLNVPTNGLGGQFVGWDAYIKGDAATLDSASIGNVLFTDPPNAECVDGSGTGCGLQDGFGVVHSGVITQSSISVFPDATLFSVTYKVEKDPCPSSRLSLSADLFLRKGGLTSVLHSTDGVSIVYGTVDNTNSTCFDVDFSQTASVDLGNAGVAGVFVANPPAIWNTALNSKPGPFTTLVTPDYYWDWGDGTNTVPEHPDTVHIYTTEGNFNVRVCMIDYVNDNVCGASHTICAAHPLTADFDANTLFNPLSPILNPADLLSFSFNATVKGGKAPYTFSWDFGDGMGGTGKDVVHTYMSPGAYNVTLTVTDISPCGDTQTFTISETIFAGLGFAVDGKPLFDMRVSNPFFPPGGNSTLLNLPAYTKSDSTVTVTWLSRAFNGTVNLNLSTTGGVKARFVDRYGNDRLSETLSFPDASSKDKPNNSTLSVSFDNAGPGSVFIVGNATFVDSYGNQHFAADGIFIPVMALGDNPGWRPFGPLTRSLQFQFYSDATSEFKAFEGGQLDLADGGVPVSDYSSYSNNPDFALSQTQGQYAEFGIYFNGASTTWKNWGCDWNAGIPFSTSEETYVSQCGVNMRQAFEHLVDRPAFARDVLGGTARALADPSPPAKDPSGSPMLTQCSWDPLFPNCISAYNIRDDPGGFAQPGSPDFCAAADHMILAGLASGKTVDCRLTGVSPGVMTHPLRFIIRTDSARRALGDGLANAINQLFGAMVVTATHGSIGTISSIVFFDPPDGELDDWDAYTYSYQFAGPYPDHLYGLYYSQQASDYCGGTQKGFPDNPTFVCIPQLDNHLLAASRTSDISTFKIETLAALDEFGRHAVDIPVFSPGVRTVALRSVAGLVDAPGAGFSNSWTILNAHKDFPRPGYVLANPIYQFGGGDQTRVRWGQAEGTMELNIFNAHSETEMNVLGEVYDTLFAAGPVQPGTVFCWMCNNYSQSIDRNGDTHFLVELRQNLRWQDGVPIDAYDVKFSLLNLRDHQTQSRLSQLERVNVLNSRTLEIVYAGQSLSYLFDNIQKIIPRHLWELPGDKTYGDVGTVDPVKLSPSYDPTVTGIFIGSGPFLCRSVFAEDLGRVGTGCIRTADGSRGGQSIAAGGTMLLQAYDRTSEPGNTDPFLQYMRSYNTSWGTGNGTAAFSGQYQEFSWADVNNDGTVTILDLASVAACFGASGPTASCSVTSYNYWLRPALHPDTPDRISTEIAVVASHFDDTWTYPYSWPSQQSGQTLDGIVLFTP